MEYIRDLLRSLYSTGYLTVSKVYDYSTHWGEKQPPRERHAQFSLTTRTRAFFAPPDKIVSFDTGSELYVGSAFNAAMITTLKSLNISAVVNTTEEVPAFWDYSGHIDYRVLSLRDVEAQGINSKEVQRVLNFIHFYVSRGENVFIHCFMGASRSVMIATLYLMARRNWKHEQAYHFIKKNRSIANLNNTFLFLLRNFPVSEFTNETNQLLLLDEEQELDSEIE